MKWSALIFLMIKTFFDIGYCGHPSFPYAHIQLEQATKLILLYFQEEDHSLIYDTLNNNKRYYWFAYTLFTDLKKLIWNGSNEWWSKILFICANIWIWVHFFLPSYDISFCVFPTQIHVKVCWWITQLQIWVALMIIWMLHHVPKKLGEMVLLPLFCTFPNVLLSVKQNLLQQHLFTRNSWIHFILV